MERNREKIFRMAGFICGIISMLAGAVIVVCSTLEIESGPSWQLFYGIIFIIMGIVYMLLNRRRGQ